MPDRLHVDFESASRIDLRAVGLGQYSRSPTTRVLMESWAINDGPVKLWLPSLGEPEPAELREARFDPHVEKHAWNADFERAIYRHVLRMYVAGVWRDTAVLARYLSLPGDLFTASRIANKGKDMQKSADGMRLIRKFSMPNKVSKARPFAWADYATDPADWEQFCEYCIQDTEAERNFYHIASKYPMPAREWALYELEHQINERGIPINVPFAEAAFDLAERDKKKLKSQLRKATGLPNAMGQAAFLAWARERGYPFGNLRKSVVTKAIDTLDADDPLREVLVTRVKAGRNTPAKYETVAALADKEDQRARYMIIFRGAQRTGRHSGSKFQPHNLARIQKRFLVHLEEVVEMIEQRDYDLIELWHGSVVDTVSNVVRCVVQAPEGRTLIVCDLNAIENRVLGWLSGCSAILDVFKKGLDPYKAFGVHLFGKPYEDVTRQERDDSKPPCLGCGYGLGGGDEVEDKNGDIVKTGLWGYAESMGVKLTRKFSHKAVALWRDLHPEVKSFWYELDDAAQRAVLYGETIRVGQVVLDKFRAAMRIRLPSGRYLHYIDPKYVTQKFSRHVTDEEGNKLYDQNGEPIFDEWEKQSLTYMGVHQTTKKWCRMFSHGGKLCVAGTSLVLTLRGWVQIKDVLLTDRLWDGLEWVTHAGLVFNGVKQTMTCFGVDMTPDHEVLTEEGWRRASQSKGHNRADCRLPDGVEIPRVERAQVTVGSEVRLQESDRPRGKRYEEDGSQRSSGFLRMPKGRDHREQTSHARYDGPPCVLGVAQYAGPMPTSYTSGVAQLWWAWHQGLQSLGGIVRGLLGRHGADVCCWVDVGADKEPSRVQQEQLQVGDIRRPEQQQTRERAHQHSRRSDDCFSSCEEVQNQCDDDLVPNRSQLAGQVSVGGTRLHQQVFDIVNCGPRRRFVVVGFDGPLIVHNCENITQAVACDVLDEGKLRARDNYGFEIVMHVHDEIVVECDDLDAIGLPELTEAMTSSIAWAPGLPLAAAGYVSRIYRKE